MVSLKLQLGRAACGPASKDVSAGGMGSCKPPWSFSAPSECDRADAMLVAHQQEKLAWVVQMHGRGWFRRDTVGAIGEQKDRPWPKAEIRSSSEREEEKWIPIESASRKPRDYLG